jgi:hypothetical protein
MLLNPNYGEGLAGYADFLIRSAKYDRALEIVERVKGNE